MTSSLITGLTSGLAAPSARDPLQAQREARVREAKAALETMRQQQTSATDQRKAAAKKKVEDLKARIQMLKMSMPSDPRALARMVSQLSRELGAAVKAYGGAGGSMTDLGSTGSNVAPAADGQTASAVGKTTQAASSADVVTAEETGEVEGPDGEEKTTLTDPYRQAFEKQQAQSADQARKAEGTKADSEFMTTVKGITADLKAMAKKAEADAKRSGENGSDADAAKSALATVDAQVDAAAKALTGGMVSLTV